MKSKVFYSNSDSLSYSRRAIINQVTATHQSPPLQVKSCWSQRFTIRSTGIAFSAVDGDFWATKVKATN